MLSCNPRAASNGTISEFWRLVSALQALGMSSGIRGVCASPLHPPLPALQLNWGPTIFGS